MAPTTTDRLDIRLGRGDKDRIRARAFELGYVRAGDGDMTAYVLDLVRADLTRPLPTASLGEAVGIFSQVRGLRLHPEDLRRLTELETQVRAAGRLVNDLVRLQQTGRTPRSDIVDRALDSLAQSAAALASIISPPQGPAVSPLVVPNSEQSAGDERGTGHARRGRSS